MINQTGLEQSMTHLKGISMQFTEVSFGEVYEDLLPMFEDHYQEIARYKDIPLDPDVDRYLMIEENEGLKMYVMFDSQGPQGYALFFVSPHIHYKGSLQAMQDVLYIQSKHRKTGIGSQFISYCDDELRKYGVQIVHQHSKAAKDFGSSLVKLGYEHVENIYSKRLDVVEN